MSRIKKGLLIFPILKDVGKADGIVAKNEGIRKAFLHYEIDLDVLEFYSSGIFKGEELIYPFSSNKYKRIFQYQINSWKHILLYVVKQKYDFIWFRMPIIQKPISDFVSGLKKSNPSCKIILEYGYYPFANELSNVKRFFYKLNRSYELKAHRNADFAVTYSGITKVDNLINIPINNGFDLESLPIVKIKTNVLEQVNLICVSSLKKWHAYERLIEGMGKYIQQNSFVPIHLNIVGDGPERLRIEQLANDLNLKSYVTFHNFKIGTSLDEVYNDNHIAIGTLGLHRLGITFSSSLKNREYIGRGLPMILSTPDEDMPEGLPYVLYVEESDAPLNINKIVNFAQEIYNDKDINFKIREYAEEHVSWKSKIQTVINFLENKHSDNVVPSYQH